MKTRPLALLFLAPAMAARAQTPAPPTPSPRQPAVMEAFRQAGNVGPNHRLLQSFVGEWEYRRKAWMDPTSPPQEGGGTTTYRSLMDGRFVQHEHKGTFMGVPYHGIGLFGYDNVTKRFQAHFFENTGHAG